MPNAQPMPLAEGRVGTPGGDLIAHRAGCRGGRLKHTTDWIRKGTPRPGRLDITTCEGCGRRHVHRIDIELVLVMADPGDMPEILDAIAQLG